MNKIEKMVSEFLSKSKDAPVVVEIGDIPPEVAERIKATINKAASAPRSATQTVTIPITAYAELLRARAKLDVIEAMHFKAAYGMENLLISMFGEKPSSKDAADAAKKESKGDA